MQSHINNWLNSYCCKFKMDHIPSLNQHLAPLTEYRKQQIKEAHESKQKEWKYKMRSKMM